MNFQWKKQNEKSLAMHIKDFIYIYVPFSENNNIRQLLDFCFILLWFVIDEEANTPKDYLTNPE